MKLCKDCKHYYAGDSDFCRREVKNTDLVTGQTLYRRRYARDERHWLSSWLFGNCGPEAKYFEAKEPKS